MSFDELETELETALTENNAPLPYEAAKAAVGGGMKAELVLDKVATIEERDGQSYVVGLGDDVMDFTTPDEASPTEEDDAPATDAESDDSDTEEARDDDIPPEDVETTPDEVDPAGEWYNLAGLRITVDPREQKVGEPTGDDYNGLPILDNGRDDVPNPDTDYYPIKIQGGVDSEQVIGRFMGVMNVPTLVEGEAGTGKNTAFANFASATHRVYNRMDFGDDTTVFDLIGEKDIVGGTSVYILGDLSKSAIFGHVFGADEISMAEGDVTSHLHSITENVGQRRLNLRGTGRTLRDLPVTDAAIEAAGGRLAAIREKWDDAKHLGRYIHPEFRFVATTNPISYAGTSDMNGAFRSRFAVLELDYLEPKHEAKLLADKTGIDKDAAKKLTRLADGLREAHKNNELMCPITFRELEKTVELAGPQEEFMDLKAAARIILKGHASQKLDKQTIVDSIADEL